MSVAAAPEFDRLIRGDCNAAMQLMPAGCIDLVFADPPFNIGVAGIMQRAGQVCYHLPGPNPEHPLVRRGHVMADSQSTTVPPVEYRGIPGWPGYRAGDDGSVWSSRGRWGTVDWHQLKPTVCSSNGYLMVALHGAGRQRTKAVHQLVLLAFVGEPPAGQECCHDNGNRTDARRSNLYYGTREQNQRDKARHGTQQQGEAVHFAKLDAEAVRDIRALVAGGWSMSRAAKKYHITAGNVHAIVHRKTWKHVA